MLRNLSVRRTGSAIAFGLLSLAGLAPESQAQSLALGSLTSVMTDTGLSRVLWAGAAPGDGTNRMFFMEQPGRIRILQNGAFLATPFLDITALVLAAGTNPEFNLQGDNEQGLLGLAFHPNYVTNGYFYVYYIAPRGSTFTSGGLTYDNGKSVLVRYTRSASNPNLADPASAYPIMTFDQPYTNHNGGNMKFGSDGYLYIGTGDGGSGNDPNNNAGNPNVLLGKLLRIDVNGDDFPTDATKNYSIPAGNPTTWPTPSGSTSVIRRENWSIGLRNPWRWSFDRLTGDLWIGDVGQDAWEEIDFVPGNGGNQRNYGWRSREGLVATANSAAPYMSTGFTEPVYAYAHTSTICPTCAANTLGSTVTGGYVYRGTAIPGWRGRYFFADYISNRVWSFRLIGGVVTDFQDHTSQFSSPNAIVSFAEDAAGELYTCHFVSPRLRKIVPTTLSNSLSIADIVQIGGAPGPDGAVTGDDFIAFINAFANGDLLADVVGIGGQRPPDNLVTGDDFIAFINAFGAG